MTLGREMEPSLDEDRADFEFWILCLLSDNMDDAKLGEGAGKATFGGAVQEINQSLAFHLGQIVCGAAASSLDGTIADRLIGQLAHQTAPFVRPLTLYSYTLCSIIKKLLKSTFSFL